MSEISRQYMIFELPSFTSHELLGNCPEINVVKNMSF
jgi:hypothetical protein